MPAPTLLDRMPRTRLVLLAFLMLFVELTLIRWLGANVLYLAYFSNIVLLGSFLGIGLGFLRAGRSERPLLPFAPGALAATAIAARVLDVEVNIAAENVVFFGISASGPRPLVVLPVVFAVVTVVLMCIGDGLARAFRQLDNLDAYSLDIVGSILGSVGFALLAFVHAPPVVWGAIIAAVLLVTIAPRTVPATALAVLPLVPLLWVWAADSIDDDTVWTPYYKTTVQAAPAGVIALVNGVPTWYQHAVQDSPIYQTVYERIAAAEPGEVLVIGAGSGNDVAAALARGATRVDAVEIDAHLLDLGRRHADRPYDDPRVVTHVQDGRAFLEQTDREWDVILFALPDSLTLLTGQSAIRLESFLFTSEAIEAAHAHLRPGGVFAMYNYYREGWLKDRFAGTVADAFGTDPCVSSMFEDAPLTVITASDDPASLRCPPGEQWSRPANVVPAATDDRPFPYLRKRTIPQFYLATIALILVASVAAVRLVGGPFTEMRPYLDLFCMGVAFLLLETKHIVQFALLFGTTWLVNALVFVGVLLSVLLAIAVTRRVTIGCPVLLYPALFAALALAWLVPGSALLDLAVVPRFLAAVTLAFLPIFTANLIFARRFKDTADSTAAFGANLLGAMVGGLLEYTSLVLGYRNLVLVVAAVYAVALISGRRYLRPA
jgi:SAM-dependent methyltransferase